VGEGLPRRLEAGDGEQRSIAGADTYALAELIKDSPKYREKAKSECSKCER
jgi:hypothetical protein